MFIRIVGVLALAASLGGCQTVAHNTASGKPEVTIQNADVPTVKSALVNRHLSNGYTVSADTPFMLQVEKPTDNMMATVLLGSQFNAIPNARVAYNIAQLGPNVRVVADLAFVTNPGSAFEKRTPVTGSQHSQVISQYLSTGLEADVRALSPTRGGTAGQRTVSDRKPTVARAIPTPGVQGVY